MKQSIINTHYIFIKKYPYFDEMCLKDNKKGSFSYFGMNNYYDKKSTKKILDKLKKQIPDNNKSIIKTRDIEINYLM